MFYIRFRIIIIINVYVGIISISHFEVRSAMCMWYVVKMGKKHFVLMLTHIYKRENSKWNYDFHIVLASLLLDHQFIVYLYIKIRYVLEFLFYYMRGRGVHIYTNTVYIFSFVCSVITLRVRRKIHFYTHAIHAI